MSSAACQRGACDTRLVLSAESNEFILGFEHELISDFSVGVNATYRKLNDFTESVPEKGQGSGNIYGPSDYAANNITLATGGRSG